MVYYKRRYLRNKYMQDMYKATYGKRAWSFYLLYEQVTFPTSPGITTPIALQTPTLWVVMEASLYRHKWSHHGSTTKVILTKPTLVHNTLLTKAFQGLPFSPHQAEVLTRFSESWWVRPRTPSHLHPATLPRLHCLSHLPHGPHSLQAQPHLGGSHCLSPLPGKPYFHISTNPSLSFKFLLSYHPISVSSLTTPIRDGKFPSPFHILLIPHDMALFFFTVWNTAQHSTSSAAQHLSPTGQQGRDLT